MFIGGLQGANGKFHTRKSRMRRKPATGYFQTPRDGSGLSVCPTFAGRADIAVSNETHIYRSLRYRDKEARSMPITTLSGNRLAAYVMLTPLPPSSTDSTKRDCRNRQ